MMRYSQNDEQDHILAYFGDHKGTFLDLGANDGITLSNTRALAQMGWGGLLVDASPGAIRRARETYLDRDDIRCYNLAIHDVVGTVTLHESGVHLGRGDHALLSSIIHEETMRWRPSHTFTEIPVSCVTVARLFELCGRSRFDMVSIDIEGADLTALRQMDLSDMGCRLLVVEVNDRDPAPYLAHAARHGLHPIHRTPENLIVAR